jgi:hypothetical protein
LTRRRGQARNPAANVPPPGDRVDLLRHALGGPAVKEPSNVSDFDGEDLRLHAPPPRAARHPFTDPVPTDSEQAEVIANIHEAYRQARESALWRTVDDAASGRLEHALWRAADHARSPAAQAARPEIVPMPAGSVPCVLVRWEPAPLTGWP